jgi:hypothetical protein
MLACEPDSGMAYVVGMRVSYQNAFDKVQGYTEGSKLFRNVLIGKPSAVYQQGFRFCPNNGAVSAAAAA